MKNVGTDLTSTAVKGSEISALARGIDAGEYGLFIQFGGMASSYYSELKSAWVSFPHTRLLIEAVCDVLSSECSKEELSSTGYFDEGIDPRKWFDGETPSEEHLLSSSIAQPLLFLTQMVNLMILTRNGGFDWDFLSKNLKGVAGHSQGITPAVLLSIGLDDDTIVERAKDVAVWLLWRGVRMQQAYPPASIPKYLQERAAKSGDDSYLGPMAAVKGLEEARLHEILYKLNEDLPDNERIYVSLKNGWNRFVLSSHIGSLVLLRELLEKKKQIAARDGGEEFDYDWEYLRVTAPFHSPYQRRAMELFKCDTDRLGIKFLGEDLKVPVYSTSDGSDLRSVEDLTDFLIADDFCGVVDWPRVLKNASADKGITHIIDMGAGDSTAKLTYLNRVGDGIRVLSFSTPDGKKEIFSHDDKRVQIGQDWRKYAPKLRRLIGVGDDHSPRYTIDNSYTRFTKSLPVFGGGMTPCTVETDVVSAAANANYIVELAGGGQVTEKIFRKRMKKLSEDLEPGRGVVVNTMWLDPYLWNLHYPLIIQLKREGYPIVGVTISAGVPEKEKAREILKAFNSVGIWCNSFKPGGTNQIRQVLEIADDNPEFKIMMHVEGGKAGGHHSWSDLRKLILENYSKIRGRGNVVLCVGGGIWDEENASSWLAGSWHGIDSLPKMPVDAVFLGTRLMACKEVKTSAQVKKLLVETKGQSSWVRKGEFLGGMTSGISPLGADIHYVDNHASRFASYLNRVSEMGDDEIRDIKSELVEGLNKTAKPYFGDLDDMTYEQVLRRMAELMAPDNIDQHIPCDGRWYDASFKERFQEFVRRAEARFGGGARKVLNYEGRLDRPEDIIDELKSVSPEISEFKLHPEDVDYFISLCKKPGKPVNFVPRIDGEIKRWFNSDSLWQSHDSRFDADGIFVIPGPESVQGIKKADEPVVDVLLGFTGQFIDDLKKELNGDTLDVVNYIGEERRRVPGGVTGSLSAALTSPFIIDGKNITRNFINGWLNGSDKSGLSCRKDSEGNVYEVWHNDGWSVSSRDGRIQASYYYESPGGNAAHLSYQMEYNPDIGMAPLRLLSGEREKSVTEFYKAVWDLDSLKNKSDGVLSVKIDEGQVAKYAAAIGDNNVEVVRGLNGHFVAPLNQVFSFCWPAILTSIFDVLGELDLLRLVHLSNEFTEVEGCISEGDELEIEAMPAKLEEDQNGTKVLVRCLVRKNASKIMELISEFYIRSAIVKTTSAGVGGAIEPDAVDNSSELPVLNPVTVLRKYITSPRSAETFARASGDYNPIHLSKGIASLAGFGEPVMHGMWLSGSSLGKITEHLLGGSYDRVRSYRIEFLQPVSLDERVELQVDYVANKDGRSCYEMKVLSIDGNVVASGRLESSKPDTAYLFTGQGSQKQGMGMDGYERSSASKKVWDDADAFCRGELGFSILEIVRDNPRSIKVGGEILFHPKGALNLTQFTQVALVVLAMAHVAELKEAGLYVDNAVIAGHSLGEYAALAIEGIISLKEVVKIVYHRGLTMQHFVPRDEKGNSPYRMIAVRPNIAGLSHGDLMSKVESIASENCGHIEVVNFNIMDEQYAITGELAALSKFKEFLRTQELKIGAAKKSYIELSGIDVPFHSQVLRPGVEVFREKLKETILSDFDFKRLEGRYIPNLNAKPFELSWEYIQGVYEYTQSRDLKELIDKKQKTSITSEAARTLLIELLAYQFASPVQWIKTQDVLLNVLSVERIIEIGPAPVLVGMAKRTMGKLKNRIRYPDVLHVDADRINVFETSPVIHDECTVEKDADSNEENINVVPAVQEVKAVQIALPIERSEACDAPDITATVIDALKVVLALKTKRSVDCIVDSSTIESLSGGNSAKRNEILADISAEFNIAQIDNAHNLPLSELSARVESASKYTAPGSFLRVTIDKVIKEIFPVALGDIAKHMKSEWGFGDNLINAIIIHLPVFSKDGESVDGGALSEIGIKSRITDHNAAISWIDLMILEYAKSKGIAISKRQVASGSGATVDSAALEEFERKYFGVASNLSKAASEILKACGVDIYESIHQEDEGIVAEREALALYRSELGDAFEQVITPRFDRARHVAFTSSIQWLKRDLVEMFYGNMNDENVMDDAIWNLLKRRVASASNDSTIVKMVNYFASSMQDSNMVNRWSELQGIIEGTEDVYWPQSKALKILAEDLLKKRDSFDWLQVDGDATQGLVKEIISKSADKPLSFQNKTVLITGAGPGSIAEAILKDLILAGAKVIVTTSGLNRERLKSYRKLYQEYSSLGSEMHLVPASQGSRKDISELLNWCFEADLAPDILIPFGAYTEKVPLNMVGQARWSADMRVMLEGVECLVTGIADRLGQSASDQTCGVVIPLSPNHGTFGGDGVYAETKLALEAMIHKRFSEYDFWGSRMRMIGVSIGWTRGTGLMKGTDSLAGKLESKYGIRTFSNEEMAWLIEALMSDEIFDLSDKEKVFIKLHGGFDGIDDIAQAIKGLGDNVTPESKETQESSLMRKAKPGWFSFPETCLRMPERLENDESSLDDTIVVVGMGEVSPFGSHRTRWDFERNGNISLEGIVELAWMMGLIKYEQRDNYVGWIDVASGDSVNDIDMKKLYEKQILENTGVRIADPTQLGFDPQSTLVLTNVVLEDDSCFPVSSLDEAKEFLLRNEGFAEIVEKEGGFLVRLKKGAVIKVPKSVKLKRYVSGQVPAGWDAVRYGVPRDIIEQADRNTVFSMVATAEAFLAAGIDPEELYEYVHPARVGNTQGSGLGGMKATDDLYHCHREDKERKGDALQELLINVMPGWVNQTFVGSYGPTVPTVAACATAAVSLGVGYDLIKSGKADFVVTGASDDLNEEGSIGFGDMGATVDCDEMLAKGVAPNQMSRPNDRRRNGFIEGQGGGVLLLAKLSKAVEMGLPVYAALAFTATHSDGHQTSIPAPGLGLVNIAEKDAGIDGEAPLISALSKFNLGVDDIHVVSKHDTSTNLNDSNENDLHQRIAKKLGRKDGNPILVHSQKSILGHGRGGAAAWQANAAIQILLDEVVPGNPNLDDVDPAFAKYDLMTFTDRAIPLHRPKAVLLTSLGFGHVGAAVLFAHPHCALNKLSETSWVNYRDKLKKRNERSVRRGWENMLGMSTMFAVGGKNL
jgi:fatty acid synthase, bacteria type